MSLLPYLIYCYFMQPINYCQLNFPTYLSLWNKIFIGTMNHYDIDFTKRNLIKDYIFESICDLKN